MTTQATPCTSPGHTCPHCPSLSITVQNSLENLRIQQLQPKVSTHHQVCTVGSEDYSPQSSRQQAAGRHQRVGVEEGLCSGPVHSSTASGPMRSDKTREAKACQNIVNKTLHNQH